MMTSHFKINGKMPRQAVLEQAITLTTQKRNREYGEPKENFERTADMLNAYLGKRLVDPLTAADIAMFGIVLKMGRLAENQKSDDSWRDIAGYAALGFEMTAQPKKRGRPLGSRNKKKSKTNKKPALPA